MVRHTIAPSASLRGFFAASWLFIFSGIGRAGPESFGRAQLDAAIHQAKAVPQIELSPRFDPMLGPETYRVERGSDGAITLAAGGPVGAMYGALDAAEAIRLGRTVTLRPGVHAPSIGWRGLVVSAAAASGVDAAKGGAEHPGYWRTLLRNLALEHLNVLVICSPARSSSAGPTGVSIETVQRDADEFGVAVLRAFERVNGNLEIGGWPAGARAPVPGGNPGGRGVPTMAGLPVRQRLMVPSASGSQAGDWVEIADDVPPEFRGGDPDDVREVVTALRWPGSGFLLGPEFAPTSVGDSAAYRRMLWGRLGYDATLLDTAFEALVGVDYPGVPPHRIFRVLQAVAHSMPLIRRYFGAAGRWMPEACSRAREGALQYGSEAMLLADRFSPDAGLLSVSQWRSDLLGGRRSAGLTPEQVADQLQGNAAETIAVAESLRRRSGSCADRGATLDDCEALAWLARFYSAKLRCAASLGLFDATEDPDARTAAIRYAANAQAFWTEFVRLTLRHHGRVLRNGMVDLDATTARIASDVETVNRWRLRHDEH